MTVPQLKPELEASMKILIDDIEYIKKQNTKINDEFSRALEIRFDSDAGDNLTIREYLHELLSNLIDQREDFNSKRPYGNSDWIFDIYKQLIKNGFIPGTLDEDGYIQEINEFEARVYVLQLVTQIFFGIQKDVV